MGELAIDVLGTGSSQAVRSQSRRGLARSADGGLVVSPYYVSGCYARQADISMGSGH